MNWARPEGGFELRLKLARAGYRRATPLFAFMFLKMALPLRLPSWPSSLYSF